MRGFARVRKGERAQGMTEYATLLALMAIAVILALSLLGGGAKSAFNSVSTTFGGGASTPTPVPAPALGLGGTATPASVASGSTTTVVLLFSNDHTNVIYAPELDVHLSAGLVFVSATYQNGDVGSMCVCSPNAHWYGSWLNSAVNESYVTYVIRGTAAGTQTLTFNENAGDGPGTVPGGAVMTGTVNITVT